MKFSTLISLTLLAITLSSQAKVISINFERDNSDDELASSSQAGVIPASHWNNINVGATGVRAINIPATALNDHSGNTTSASLAVNLGSAYVGSSGSGTSTPDHRMMASYLSWDPVDGTSPEDTGTLTLSNLPAEITAGYKVYVYFDADVNTRTFDITVAGSTETTRNAADASTFSGTYLKASDSPANANYAVFTGMTASTFTIAMNSDSGRAPVNGIQIVSDDHVLAPTIEIFSANDHYVTPGSLVTLEWETSGADTISINPGIGDVSSQSSDGNGQASTTVDTSTSYTLTATNTGGSTTATVKINTGPPRPNIVFFLVDDMGPQDTSVPFEPNGANPPASYNFNTFYQTPNMETLAANGMRFTAAYAQSVCSPTRTGLMTGRNSARHAVSNWVGSGSAGSGGSPNNWRSSGLDASDVCLPQILSDAGYKTIHVGKAHFGSNSTGRDPLNLGFDVNIGGANFGHPGSYTGTYGSGGSHAVPHLEAYHNTGTFLTKALATEANKAIQHAHDEGRPFFLNMSFYAVHSPFTHNPDATGDYSAAHSTNHNKYATMLEGMDLAVGQIRQKLIDLGIAENTLIIFVGDNGSDSPAIPAEGLPNGIYSDYPLRGKKGSKYEGGSRIPFIACWASPTPSNQFQLITPITGNTVEDDIVTTWDIPVTFLSLAGIAKPANFGEDGHDLLPYFRGTAGTHRPQEIVIHYPHNHRSDFFSWIRKGNMKLIYNYQNNSHQLYNLATDPTESNDLASTQPETLMQLSRALAQGLAERWGDRGALIPTASSSAPNGNVVSIPNNPSIDSDNDGLPDTNEDPNLNGLVDPGETNPDNSNSDGDNLSDSEEARLGTDPLDANSYFFCVPSTEADGSLLITWPSSPGASFTILSSSDLIDWSTVVTSGLPASAAATTSYKLGQPGSNRRFYRIKLEAATGS